MFACMPDFFVFPGIVDGPDVCVCVGWTVETPQHPKGSVWQVNLHPREKESDAWWLMMQWYSLLSRLSFRIIIIYNPSYYVFVSIILKLQHVKVPLFAFFKPKERWLGWVFTWQLGFQGHLQSCRRSLRQCSAVWTPPGVKVTFWIPASRRQGVKVVAHNQHLQNPEAIKLRNFITERIWKECLFWILDSCAYCGVVLKLAGCQVCQFFWHRITKDSGCLISRDEDVELHSGNTFCRLLCWVFGCHAGLTDRGV